jgi:uncharacterized protein (TIGR03437 family)
MTGPSGTGGGGQQPAITAVVNGASYSAGSVAPGSILTIFGSNIGPAALTSGTFTNGQLSTSAGGVQVTFDNTAAPILYARSNQVGVIVPFEASGKTQSAVQFAYNGQMAPVLQQPIAPAAPGIFTTASTGTGQASVINQTGVVNAANAPAAKGSIVAIYLTGAGTVTPAGSTGALGTASQAIAASVSVTIGGLDAPVSYSGAAPDAVLGLYQINATVPSASASGSVPLVVKVGGVSSQAGVTIYVQ